MTTQTLEKDGGLNYPVQPGETWRTDHVTIHCNDLAQGAAAFFDTLNEQPALCYVDPPWTPSLASGYRTKASVPVRRAHFHALITEIVRAGARAGGLCVEIGLSQFEMVRQVVVQQPKFQTVNSCDITYYRRHPGKLIVAATLDQAAPYQDSLPHNMDDEFTPHWAIRQFTQPGKLVIDPCTGRGLTALYSVRLNRRFAGTELNPHRVSVALTRLRDAGDGEPKRVSQE
jgi:hypothetical protein